MGWTGGCAFLTSTGTSTTSTFGARLRLDLILSIFPRQRLVFTLRGSIILSGRLGLEFVERGADVSGTVVGAVFQNLEDRIPLLSQPHGVRTAADIDVIEPVLTDPGTECLVARMCPSAHKQRLANSTPVLPHHLGCGLDTRPGFLAPIKPV